jgi:L-proline amide hydrolase
MNFSFDEFANPDPSLTGYAPFGAYETWYSVTGSLESSLTPIIVIHGGPGSTHDYVTPLRQIALGGYPVIHYDQVGCGFSSQLGEAEIADLTMEFFLDELNNLIQWLGVADDYILLGHSWGGMVALEHALLQPKGLSAVILSSALASAATWKSEAIRLGSALAGRAGEDFRAMKNGTPTTSETYGLINRAYSTAHLFSGPVNWVDSGIDPEFDSGDAVYRALWGSSEFDFDGRFGTWSVVDRLGEVTTPTLVIWGEHDESTRLVNSELLQGIWESVEAEILGGGHVTWADALTPYLAAVMSFLGALDGERA